jgi:hypothetical protein
MENKLQKQVQFVRSLSIFARETIEWYSGSDFEQFNQKLRKGEKLSISEKIHLDQMDQIFYAIPPLDKPLTVYKGKHSQTVYSDKAFISTTLDYNRTADFRGIKCCVLQIFVSPGSKVVPFLDVSSYPSEKEILLDRDGTMVVTGTEINEFDMKIIFATYIPKDGLIVESKNDIDRAVIAFDSNLIIERMVTFFKDEEDTDFIDDEIIALTYKQITKGEKISPQDLAKIKLRLNLI